MNKIWYIPVNGILFSQNKKELMYAATQINLENIRASERSQTQEAMYCMIPIIWNVQNCKSIETK